MRLLKDAGAGLAGALLALVVYVLIELLRFAAPLWWASGEGSGGVGYVSADSRVLLSILVIGFVLGVWWRRYSARRNATRSAFSRAVKPMPKRLS
jgi:hypothetical protein